MPQKRLTEEFEKRDWVAETKDPNEFYAYLSDKLGYDRIYERSEGVGHRITLKEYSAVVPRISGRGFGYGLLVLDQINRNLGIFSTASSYGLEACSVKFNTSQLLSRHKIRVPRQILAHKLTDFKEAIEKVGGLPVIVKLQKGSQGAGVFKLRDEVEASQSLRALRYASADLILQQTIDSGKPANDLRIWVIGAYLDEPKVIAYKRYALDSDFRSNYSISGSGEKVEITEEEKSMAIKAAQALRMHIAGVDIMRDSKDNNKPYLIEVNGNPGLSGVEAITGENVAGEVAQFVIDNYKKDDSSKRSLSLYLESAKRTIQEVMNGTRKGSGSVQALAALKLLEMDLNDDPYIKTLM
ncbi:MAG: RimK family alpha-L-glutamate ligase [Bacteroidales bacterium]|nr:RimK family alpha-L-glutamate ligase [Bacteroidales bacterium]